MTGPKLHYASQFIIAAMDEWGGPVTPTTGTPVYLKQDYDALQAKVRELEEQIRVATAINHAFKQSEENLEATLHTQQDRIRELEERLGEVEAGRECVHIDEYQALQDRVHELEDKLRQVEQERDQARDALRELYQRVSRARTMAGSYYIYAPDMDAVVERAKHALGEG